MSLLIDFKQQEQDLNIHLNIVKYSLKTIPELTPWSVAGLVGV